MHGKHALDLGTQPVDRIEETMGSRVLPVHRCFFAPGEAAAEVPHVVIDAGAGGYMSEKSILRIPCASQSPASEPEKHMAAKTHRDGPFREFRGRPQGKVAISSCGWPWNSYDIAGRLYRILRIATLLFILFFKNS